MSNVQWIKITTNIFDDEKIRLIESLPDADMLLVIWFKLLTLAGKCNEGGLIYLTRDVPYNPEMLSTILRRPVNTIRLALQEFQNLRMIEVFDDIISIINWEKHQTLHKLEMAKEQTRKRVQTHRENQKALRNVTVTKCNADREEKIREDKIREDKNTDTLPDIELDVISFDIFWKSYNKKVDRVRCEKLWRKINPDSYNLIFTHVEEYVRSTPDKKFRKDPGTYLFNQCWNNEIISTEKKQSASDIAKRLEEKYA